MCLRRSFAPLVQSVVCLDATPAMLQIGKQEAEKSHLNNMTFVKGYAEELPIETLRDPSHVKNMSKNEMLELFTSHSLQIEQCETTEIQQKLSNWLALTRTPEPIQQKITERMRSELAGEEKNRIFPLCGEWKNLF